jgi:hypothetical protein
MAAGYMRADRQVLMLAAACAACHSPLALGAPRLAGWLTAQQLLVANVVRRQLGLAPWADQASVVLKGTTTPLTDQQRPDVMLWGRGGEECVADRLMKALACLPSGGWRFASPGQLE